MCGSQKGRGDICYSLVLPSLWSSRL